MLPFTASQFFDVFRQYNEAVWPAPLVLSALAAAASLVALMARPWSGRLVSVVLTILWAWTGLTYHVRFFSTINALAYAFGAASVLAAAAFAWHGVARGRLRFSGRHRGWFWIGAAVQTYALALYPLASIATGHPFPVMPTFGLPCPTTIFTIGLLAWLAPGIPAAVLVVPSLWSLVGVQAAWLLGVEPDLALLVVMPIALALVARDRWPRGSAFARIDPCCSSSSSRWPWRWSAARRPCCCG